MSPPMRTHTRGSLDTPITGAPVTSKNKLPDSSASAIKVATRIQRRSLPNGSNDTVIQIVGRWWVKENVFDD